jgi:hypothetical protein
MRGLHRRLAAFGLTLFAAGWAHADTVTFDFTGEGGVLPSVTVLGSDPLYSATATGETYDATLSSTIQGMAVFTNTPSNGSGTSLMVYQHDLGLGVDSDTMSALEAGTGDRRINSYMSYAEVLWVKITPQTGYTITSAKLINVGDGETGGLLDAAGNPLAFTAASFPDGTDLTFTPPANSYIFGVYESNRGFKPSSPGIKLSQFEITLSPSSESPAPLPAASGSGGVLIACLAARRRRTGAMASI